MVVIRLVTTLLLHSYNVTHNISNTIENVRSHPAASRILPITEKQKKANEVAERRSIMARSAALNETNDSNSTSNETTIVLGENCDETNIEVSSRPRQDVGPGTSLPEETRCIGQLTRLGLVFSKTF